MRSATFVSAALIALAAVGCRNGAQSRNPTLNDVPQGSSVLDVSAPPANAYAPPPAAAPVALPPAVAPAPTQVAAADTMVAPAPASVSNAGSTYTVRKGDTLFKIARAQYNGDLSAVKRIKSANPGIDYDHLKVGQKLVLP